MSLPVVSEEHHDSAVCQAIRFQLLQDEPTFAVQLRSAVQILGPVLTSDRMVRIVWRNAYLSWIGSLRSLKLPVGLLEVDLSIERLVHFQVFPAIGIEGLAFIVEVPICFPRTFEAPARRQFLKIGGKVAGLPHPIASHLDAFRKFVTVVAMRSLILSSNGGLIHPGDKRRAAG